MSDALSSGAKAAQAVDVYQSRNIQTLSGECSEMNTSSNNNENQNEAPDSITNVMQEAFDSARPGDVSGMMLGVFLWRMKEMLPMLEYGYQVCVASSKDIETFTSRLPPEQQEHALEYWQCKTMVIRASYRPVIDNAPPIMITCPLSASAIIADMHKLGVTETCTGVAKAILGYIHQHGLDLYRGEIRNQDMEAGPTVNKILSTGRIIDFENGQPVIEPIDINEVHARWEAEGQKQTEQN